jgi:hypothetical protein
MRSIDTQMDDEAPILDEENYSNWRIEMRLHFKTMRATIWKEAIGGSVPLQNKSNFAAQREGKKNDALAIKTILSGLSSPIKASMGQCTSAKDLWLKLEETYKKIRRRKILKTTPSTLSKVKNRQKPLIILFQNVILKTFQVKIAQRKISKVFQMKVNNLQIHLMAMIQNVMMLNFSQVKKKI